MVDRTNAVRRVGSAPGGWIDDIEETLDDDEKSSATSPSPPLLRASDAILCEWDPKQLVYFFGEGGKGETSCWDAMEEYIDPSYTEAQAAAAVKKKRSITIHDCLAEFAQEERLGEDDLWYCPRCKKHQQATKKFEIWKVRILFDTQDQ